MAYTLNENLKRWAEQYETPDFVNADPVQIPHRYDSRENIEISAFVTAWIAWGNRKQIIKKADFIDREIFKGDPYHYIIGNAVAEGKCPEWEKYKGSSDCLYRTFTFGDFHDLCARLYDVYTSAGNMEAAIKKVHENNGTLATLQYLFGSVNGIPDFETRSSCKRLCLFLRWMCRKGSPVDFGLWNVCHPRNLIIPLDTHVYKQAIRLGLTKRRTMDLDTAIEITDRFAEIFPDDPAKGDFALFGYGVDKGSATGINKISEAMKKETDTRNKSNEANSVTETIPVSDLSISDVLKMPLFFENVKNQLTSLWNDREKARMDAIRNKTRLRAHVIDRMHNIGHWEPGNFIILFAKVLDKVETGYSSSGRAFIRAVGMIAFNITMRKLIDNEKARNNSNGNDKQ